MWCSLDLTAVGIALWARLKENTQTENPSMTLCSSKDHTMQTQCSAGGCPKASLILKFLTLRGLVKGLQVTYLQATSTTATCTSLPSMATGQGLLLAALPACKT